MKIAKQQKNFVVINAMDDIDSVHKRVIETVSLIYNP